jgi:hypothetical protein
MSWEGGHFLSIAMNREQIIGFGGSFLARLSVGMAKAG